MTQVAHKGWKEAQLMIAFHRDQNGARRDHPRAWPPKDALARIHTDPSVQETFVDLRPKAANTASTQIKLREHAIVVSEGQGDGSRGIEITGQSVVVAFDGQRVTIERDGSVLIEREESDTLVDTDGRVEKVSAHFNAQISPLGDMLARKSDRTLALIREQGAIVKTLEQDDDDAL